MGGLPHVRRCRGRDLHGGSASRSSSPGVREDGRRDALDVLNTAHDIDHGGLERHGALLELGDVNAVFAVDVTPGDDVSAVMASAVCAGRHARWAKVLHDQPRDRKSVV